MESDLPEITLLVVDKNKQCNHSQHYLFRITSLLVFRYYSIHLSVLFPLSAFSFPRSPCSSVFQLKDTWSNYKVGSFSRNADEQGIQRDLKERKEHFLKNSRCKMILYFNQVARFHKYSSGPCAWRLIHHRQKASCTMKSTTPTRKLAVIPNWEWSASPQL